MEHLPYLGNAMTRMAEFLGKAEGTEEVPACPGWTVNDLAVHLGGVHRWAASIVLSGQRLREPESVVATEPLVDWYAGTATALLAAFWPRRQMHETTIHAIDAAQAIGLGDDAFAIDDVVADDGIDEVLTVFFPRMTARRGIVRNGGRSLPRIVASITSRQAPRRR